jgi:nitrate/TMAO reductase-like tetraheme cytochrome c subunit
MAGGLCDYLSAKGATLLVGAAIGIGAVTVVVGGEAAISRTEFCISCHSEIYPYEELKKSSHWGALGADPGCKDCHVPQGFANFHLAVWTHVVDGVPFLIKEFTTDYSTVEKFNEHRPEAAYRARMKLKEWDSLTCRACHKNVKAPGASAKAAHAKMQTEGATCIDCHQNLVHKKVPEHDLNASLAQGKAVIKVEVKKKDEDEEESKD